MIFESGVYQLDIDVDRTQQFYENEDYEFCTCAGCRNFAQAYSLIPDAVQGFFGSLVWILENQLPMVSTPFSFIIAKISLSVNKIFPKKHLTLP